MCPLPVEPHVFVTPIGRLEGVLVTHYVPVPPEIADEYHAAKSRRIIALLNGHEVRRYLFRTGNGEDGFVIGKHVLREVGAAPDEPIVVEMWADPEPDRVDVCEELEAVLAQDEEAGARFYGMTPGKRRSLAVHVCGAKRSETRIKRALDIAHKLRTYTLAGDRSEDRDHG